MNEIVHLPTLAERRFAELEADFRGALSAHLGRDLVDRIIADLRQRALRAGLAASAGLQLEMTVPAEAEPFVRAAAEQAAKLMGGTNQRLLFELLLVLGVWHVRHAYGAFPDLPPAAFEVLANEVAEAARAKRPDSEARDMTAPGRHRDVEPLHNEMSELLGLPDDDGFSLHRPQLAKPDHDLRTTAHQSGPRLRVVSSSEDGTGGTT